MWCCRAARELPGVCVKAGALKDRVTVQARSEVDNGRGGRTYSWANIADTPTIWARVIGLSGDESVAAAVERASMRWRVEIRRRTDITPAHRLVWGGINMDVKAAFPDPSAPREKTVLLCESGLSQDGA